MKSVAALAHEEEAFKRELGEAALISRKGGDGVFSSEVAKDDEDALRDSTERAHQDEHRHKIEKLKIRLEDSGGAGGAEVMKEYKENGRTRYFLGKRIGRSGESR